MRYLRLLRKNSSTSDKMRVAWGAGCSAYRSVHTASVVDFDASWFRVARISCHTFAATSRVDARVAAASRDAIENSAAADAFCAADDMAADGVVLFTLRYFKGESQVGGGIGRFSRKQL